SEARSMFAKAGIDHPWIGVSCHTVAEVLSAESHGADFVVFGPLFGKNQQAGTGLDRLQQACAVLPPDSSMKVIALGGIEVTNAGACVRVGAAGVAGIRLFQSGNVIATVQSLLG